MPSRELGAGDAPCIGPPPVLNIYHAQVKDISAAQLKRIILLRRKLKQEQARLLKLKEAKLKAANQQDQKQQQKSTQHKHKEQSQQQEEQQQLASPLTGFELHWADDQQTLVRMLVAREWHVPRAFTLVMEAIAFRRQLRPERIKPQEVKDMAKAGQIYRRGFDREGHPLVYLRPALNDVSGDGSATINLLIYTLERACQSQNRHCGVSAGLCFLMDYNGYSNANQPSLATALRFIQIFQCIYAEQLVAAYLIDTPWYFSTFWNCISPFLPTRTAAKIKFVSTSQPEEVKQIFEVIHPKFVESWIPGGLATSKYDSEVYWKEEAKQYETYMKFLQHEFFKKTLSQRVAEDAAFSAAMAKGLSLEEAMEAARAAQADKPSPAPAEQTAAAETQEDEEDVEDVDDPETPESLEDEQKRLLLQEAIRKQQQEQQQEQQQQ